MLDSAEEKESWMAVNGHLAVTRSAADKLKKGVITKEYRIKRHLMAVMGFEIKEVR